MTGSLLISPLPQLQLSLHLPLLLLEGLALSSMKFSLQPLLEIYWPSISGLLSDGRLLRGERRRVQRLRKINAGTFFGPFRTRHQKLSLLRRHGVPRIAE